VGTVPRPKPAPGTRRGRHRLALQEPPSTGPRPYPALIASGLPIRPAPSPARSGACRSRSGRGAIIVFGAGVTSAPSPHHRTGRGVACRGGRGHRLYLVQERRGRRGVERHRRKALSAKSRSFSGRNQGRERRWSCGNGWGCLGLASPCGGGRWLRRRVSSPAGSLLAGGGAFHSSCGPGESDRGPNRRGRSRGKAWKSSRGIRSMPRAASHAESLYGGLDHLFD